MVYIPRDSEANPRSDNLSNQSNEQLKPVGVDLGIKTQFILSNGLQFRYEVPVSKRVKLLPRQGNTERLQHILSRKKKGSKNYEHTCYLLRREYEKLNNRKRDIQNKLLAFLKHYPTVVLQDDWVKGWKEGLFWRKGPLHRHWRAESQAQGKPGAAGGGAVRDHLQGVLPLWSPAEPHPIRSRSPMLLRVEGKPGPQCRPGYLEEGAWHPHKRYPRDGPNRGNAPGDGGRCADGGE
ncbi:MAG: hypothetical protein C4337_10000 [Armatimonadota bacterium]